MKLTDLPKVNELSGKLKRVEAYISAIEDKHGAVHIEVRKGSDSLETGLTLPTLYVLHDLKRQRDDLLAALRDFGVTSS